MKVDIYKHCINGRQLWAVPAGSDPWRNTPAMTNAHDMRMLRLYRAAIELGKPAQPVFDHTRVRAEIERQGWAKIIIHKET